MTPDAGRFREEAIAAEQEESWDLWMARSLDRLWEEAGCEGPWRDAAPHSKSSSEEGEDVSGQPGEAA